jgi:hypothetical protein
MIWPTASQNSGVMNCSMAGPRLNEKPAWRRQGCISDPAGV